MLHVIGAGFPRTGTSSLKAALDQLGLGPCHHMFELLASPERAERWGPLGSGAPADWDHLLEGYHSAVDWPSAYFWRELAEAHPEAKVVLTVRDPQRWYASAHDSIFVPAASPDLPRDDSGPGRAMRAMRPLLEMMFTRHFGSGVGVPDRETAIAAFERHNAEVRATIPADRLLVFEVAQGWGPLCDFLGLTPPADAPFPRLNETQAMQRMFERAQTDGTLITPFTSSE